MIGVVDYGMGNLHSIAKAIDHVGGDVIVTSDRGALADCERIVLPGVGAFGECMANLEATELVATLEREVLERRKPFLGICVGMQLLATEGHEHGSHPGLGWLNATVDPLEHTEPGLRIPHTGWSDVEVVADSGTPFDNVRAGECFYFNHTYHVVPKDAGLVAAHCSHGQEFVAAIARDNIIATQFHPEKSQQAGLDFLADFVGWSPN